MTEEVNPRHWSPRSAVLYSKIWLGAATLLALFLIYLILDDLSYKDEWLDGLAAFFSAVILAALVTAAAPLIVFLKFRRKWVFITGAVLSGLFTVVILFFVSP